MPESKQLFSSDTLPYVVDVSAAANSVAMPVWFMLAVLSLSCPMWGWFSLRGAPIKQIKLRCCSNKCGKVCDLWVGEELIGVKLKGSKGLPSAHTHNCLCPPPLALVSKFSEQKFHKHSRIYLSNLINLIYLINWINSIWFHHQI